MSPIPKGAPSAVVGLDIGSESIKVAEAKATKDGFTITALGIARTPEGTFDNEIVVDPKALGAAIKALLTENGIKTRKCVSSVAGQSQVIVRVITVPKMKPEELAETMRWEIEKHVPFSPQEVEYDFHPLDRPGTDPDAQEMEVLLAVAQQDLVNSHVEALFAAGLQPMAIDIEPLAASRALVEVSTNGTLDETVAIVDIGANATEVGIYENGLLTFPCPPIAIAGLNFTREISEALGQTLDQAEITKKEYAAVDMAALDAMTPLAEPAAPEPPPAADTTQFDNVFGATGSAAAPEPPEEPAAPAGPAEPGAFTETADGPVFDIGEPEAGQTPEDAAGPSFDLPEEGAGGPAFDLGDEEQSVIDLGGTPSDEQPQAAPDFDLPDVESTSEPAEAGEPAPPAVDLGELGGASPPEPEAQAAGEPTAAEPPTQEQEVARAIARVLTDLAADLRRSLEYYTTQYSKTPSRVFLCGGTAKMPKLDEFLSRELGIPVQIADPLSNVRVNCPAFSPQYLREVSPLFSVSVGLAIRDMIG